MRETIRAPEAATIIGVSTWVIYELARRRAIPHIRIGRRVLFRRSSLLAWLAEQEEKSIRANENAAGWPRGAR
jgi:excisionase family DNA binding protein